MRVSHWCRSSASVAPARENACSAGIMHIVWPIVCPSILVSQGGGQELLSRHRWKELERIWYLISLWNSYEYHWFWLILAYVRSSFDQGAAATWLHRGNMIPKASLNCMIIKMNQVIATSSDCKCLVWEKWVGRYNFPRKALYSKQRLASTLMFICHNVANWSYISVNTSSLLESSLFRGMCLWSCLPNCTWIFESTYVYS